MCDHHTLFVITTMGYADTIRAELEARQWSVKRFADEIGRSPEHARKVRDGTAPPGPDLTRHIAAKLGLNLDELQEEVDIAKWEKRHSRKPPKPDHPDLGPLERVWKELTADQRQYLLCFADCLTRKKLRRPKVS